MCEHACPVTCSSNSACIASRVRAGWRAGASFHFRTFRSLYCRRSAERRARGAVPNYDELLAQIGSTRLTTRASQTMPFIKEEGGSTFLAAPAARIVNGEAAAAKAVLGSDQLVI